MLLILTYAIGIYALLVLFLFFFQRSYLYFPSREKIDISYFIDSGLKEIELTTSDGLILKSTACLFVSKKKATSLQPFLNLLS